MSIQFGELVRLMEYGGRVIERQVVADGGTRIVVFR